MNKNNVIAIYDLLFNELYEATGEHIKPIQLAKKYGLDEKQTRLLCYFNSKYKKFFLKQ